MALRQPSAVPPPKTTRSRAGEPGFGKRASISFDAVPEMRVVGRGDQQRDVAVAELEKVAAAAIAGVEIPRSNRIEERMAEGAIDEHGRRKARRKARGRSELVLRGDDEKAVDPARDQRLDPPRLDQRIFAARDHQHLVAALRSDPFPLADQPGDRTRCRGWGRRYRPCASRRAEGSTPCGWTCSRAPPPPREPRDGGHRSRRASPKAHSTPWRATRRRAPRRRGSSAVATAASAGAGACLSSPPHRAANASRGFLRLVIYRAAQCNCDRPLRAFAWRLARTRPMAQTSQAAASEAASAAAVDQLAGDPAGVVAGQEADDVGDVASRRRSA